MIEHLTLVFPVELIEQQLNYFSTTCALSAGGDGPSPLEVSASLRQLQLVLRKLEQEIASIKVSPDRGHTAPGSFLFDIFAR